MSAELEEMQDGAFEAASADPTLLTKLLELLSVPVDIDAALVGLANLVRARLDVDVVGLWMRQADVETFRLVALDGELRGAANPLPLTPQEGLLEWVTAHHEALQVSHLSDDSQILDRAWLVEEGLVSFLAVPLWTGDEAVGVMALLTRTQRAFTARQQMLVSALASVATVALGHARRSEEQERRLAEGSQLDELSRTVSATNDTLAILSQVCRRAARICGADRGSIFFWQEQARQVFPATSRLATGEPQPGLWGQSESESKPLGKRRLVQQLVDLAKPLVIEDARVSPHVSPEAAQAFRARSILAVPVILGEEVIGGLLLDTIGEIRPFKPRQVELAEAVAERLVLALHKTLLLRETQDRLRETEAQLEIAQTLSSTLELKQLLVSITQQTARACEMDRCSINLWIDGQLVPMMSQYADRRADPGLWQAYRELGGTPLAEIPFVAELQRSRRPIVIQDPDQDPLWPDQWRRYGNKAVLVVPLISKDTVIGNMALHNTQGSNPVTRRQVHLATSIASQVALALDNARFHQATEERLQQTEVLLEMARTLSSSLTLQPLLREIVGQAARACDMERCSLLLYEDGQIQPVLARQADGTEDHNLWQAFQELDRLQVEEIPALVEAFRNGEPLVLDDPANDSRLPAWLKSFGHKAMLLVPLVRHQRTVGVLAFDNTERGDPVTPAKVALATTIASQVALALDNARLHEETRARLRQAEAHLEIARTVSSTVNPKRLLKEITQQVARACEMDRCSIYSWQGGERVTPLMSQFADGRQDKAQWKAFMGIDGMRLPDVPYLAETARSGQPVVVENPPQHPLWPPSVEAGDIKVMLVVPFIRQEKVVGAMTLVNTRHSAPLRPRQVAVAETIVGQVGVATTIASQVALALDNSRLYEETERRLDETEALLELVRTIGTTLDPQELARRTCRELTGFLGADTTLYLEIDTDVGTAQTVAGFRVPEELSRLPERFQLTVHERRLIEAGETGGPVASSDLERDPRFESATLRGMSPQPRAVLYAPVVSKGNYQGALVSLWWNESHDFTAEVTRLAEGFANQMALALENARHYEQAQRALADLKAAQNQLVQSEKFRALAELGAGVAHDFNNLLTAILGRTEILRVELEGELATAEKLRAHLEVIELAANDGTETVRRLLDYTREKPHPDEAVAVDVNEILTHTREVSRPRWHVEAQSRGVEIEVVLAPGRVPLIDGNPAELREVLLNLVYNAIDAMQKGGTLTLTSGSDNDSVWLRICDTGIGMSEEVRRRIFDPFFTTKGGGSSGLGLSASYGIIHRHGGEIEVASIPGKETVFTVKLPIRARRD